LHDLCEFPIIIYQMGKVGSSSILRSLGASGYKPYHIHYLNPERLRQIESTYLSKQHNLPLHISTSRKLIKNRTFESPNCRVISLVREPISRNMSAFFENKKLFTHNFSQIEQKSINAYIKNFLSNYPHNVPLVWFDNELKGQLGIDVYAYSFPQADGYSIIKKDNIRLLILKLEISDESKKRALTEFLDISEISLQRANVGAKKDYADIYKSFLERIRLPEEYIDRMCTSKYTRHFYSDKEIEQIRYKWGRKTKEQ